MSSLIPPEGSTDEGGPPADSEEILTGEAGAPLPQGGLTEDGRRLGEDLKESSEDSKERRRARRRQLATSTGPPRSKWATRPDSVERLLVPFQWARR
mmetsp:Transcript_43832/g.102932  ORF Transcript_43832/g.102932 Transcript_43832/m.102932 type:complete len:97 (-) Transcript_43832:92-382(-)